MAIIPSIKLECKAFFRGTSFPLADANGNYVTYSDNAGNVQAHYVYDAFGGTVSSDGDMVDYFCFRFSSKYLDDETGLYYYGYRYYAPALGRWLNKDPIGERGGLLLYGFVENGSVSRYDIFGFFASGSGGPMDAWAKSLLNGGIRLPYPTDSVTFSDNCKCYLSQAQMDEIGQNLSEFRGHLDDMKKDDWKGLPSEPRPYGNDRGGPMTAKMAECIRNKLGQGNYYIVCNESGNSFAAPYFSTAFITPVVSGGVQTENIASEIVHEAVHSCGIWGHALSGVDPNDGWYSWLLSQLPLYQDWDATEPDSPTDWEDYNCQGSWR